MSKFYAVLVVIAALLVFPNRIVLHVASTLPEHLKRADATHSVHTAAELPSGTVLLVNPRAIWAVNADTLELSLHANLAPDAGIQIVGVMVSRGMEHIYLLQERAETTARSPGDKVVVVTRIDPSTQQRRVIFQRKGVLTFNLSPEGTRAAIVYAPDAETFERARETAVCVLDVASGKCSEIGLDVVGNVLWLSEDVFVAKVHGRVFQVHTTTPAVEELVVGRHVEQMAYIPARDELLIASLRSGDQAIEFAVYELSNSRVLTLPYSVGVRCPAMYALSLSPNAQRLVYNCAGTTVLADYYTGETIATFAHLVAPQWTANSRVLVALEYDAGQFTLMRIDASTGSVTKSVQLVEADMLLTVP